MSKILRKHQAFKIQDWIFISLRFGEGGEAFPIYILSFPFLFSLFPRARARAHGPGPRARGAAGPGPGPGPAAPRALGPGEEREEKREG